MCPLINPLKTILRYISTTVYALGSRMKKTVHNIYLLCTIVCASTITLGMITTLCELCKKYQKIEDYFMRNP